MAALGREPAFPFSPIDNIFRRLNVWHVVGHFEDRPRNMGREGSLRRLLAVATLAIGLIAVTSSSAGAYGGGPANWQIAFAGTGVAPTTGVGFGFWGWCQFSGGVVAGHDGDCQVSQYFHLPSGSGVTCQQSIDVTAWTGPGTFVINGTATTHPASAAATCVLAGGAPPVFAGFDTQIPAFPGHYNLNGAFGTPGELQIQVTQIR